LKSIFCSIFTGRGVSSKLSLPDPSKTQINEVILSSALNDTETVQHKITTIAEEIFKKPNICADYFEGYFM